MQGTVEKNELRENLIKDFLKANDLASARSEKIPGDASFRSYRRILNEGESYILMDAPPPQENVYPFITVAQYLTKNGFSAPKIYASNVEEGLLLLEDLGDDLYARIMNGKHSSSLEKTLYKNAIDVLTCLHSKSFAKLNIPPYDQDRLLSEAMLFSTWYLPHIAKIELTEEAQSQYNEIILSLINKLNNDKPVVVLRDYHANNLIALPARKKQKNVGLLDFQDALIGHPAYDLVSLLEDARRDVPKSIMKDIYDYFIAGNPHLNQEDFARDFAILGAQRNLKIIGIFSRLFIRDGKKQYLQFLPRVWNYLEGDLKHPELKDLKEWLDKTIDPAKRENHA